MNRPEPAFAEPWHAQLFALTVHLNETGLFTWPDWAAAFSDTLTRHGLSKELDGGEDYFIAWLETLERFLQTEGVADGEEVLRIKKSWEEAYLTTPHGHPVKLKP